MSLGTVSVRMLPCSLIAATCMNCCRNVAHSIALDLVFLAVGLRRPLIPAMISQTRVMAATKAWAAQFQEVPSACVGSGGICKDEHDF